MSKDPDHIYILECACGCAAHAKVGICTSPTSRLGQLQCGNPTRLKYLYVAKVKGVSARAFEKRVHAELSNFKQPNLPREWFALPGLDAKRALERLGQTAKITLALYDLSVFEFPTPVQLKLEREERGWSISDFARRAKIGESTISDYERGRTASPHKSTRDAIRRALSGGG